MSDIEESEMATNNHCVDADTQNDKDTCDNEEAAVSQQMDENCQLEPSVGALKKDDSGIYVEKSPSKDSSVLSEDGETNHTEMLSHPVPSGSSPKGSANDETHDASMTSNESELDSAMFHDMVDTEDSDPIGSYTLHGADSSNDDTEQMTQELKCRKRRSDQDIDLEEVEPHSAHSSDLSESSNSSSSSEEEDTAMDTDILPIPTRYQLLYDIRKQEYGFNPRKSNVLFRDKMISNLSMVQRLKLQYSLEKHEGCVNALHFNSKGTLLASGSDDLNVIIWNWASNKPALVYQSGHRSNVFQAKFMPYSNDSHVVSCARDGQVRLAELSVTGVCKTTKKVAQHRGAAHKLALEYDAPQQFLSCGEDAQVIEVDLRQDKPNKVVVAKDEDDKRVALYSIHTNPMNNHEFCVGGRDHFIRIYDKRKIPQSGETTLKRYCPRHMIHCERKANVTCAVYNYNGTEVLGTYNDEDIYLFNNLESDDKPHLKHYFGHRNNATVKGVNFYGPQSEYIISGSDCGHIFLWERESASIVQYFKGDEGGVINVLEPHPTGPFLATSGLDSDVKIWAPTAEEPVSLTKLKQIMKKNKKDRQNERSIEPEVMLDGQMLWYLMHHLQRTRRRAQRADGDEISDDSSASESEDSEAAADSVSCQPS